MKKIYLVTGLAILRRMSKQMLKKRIIIFLLLVVFILPKSNVYAYSSCVYIQVNYSDGIKATEGDLFQITYKLKDTENTATITFDASKLDKKIGKLDIDPGYYEITDILYKGSNEEIKEYAISQDFLIEDKEDAYTEIVLGIGLSEAKEVTNTYLNYLARTPGGYVRSFEVPATRLIENNNESSDSMIETNEVKETDIEEDETESEDAAGDENLKEENVYEEMEENKDNLRILKKGIPILFLAFIGTIVLFWVKKNGIL